MLKCNCFVPLFLFHSKSTYHYLNLRLHLLMVQFFGGKILVLIGTKFPAVSSLLWQVTMSKKQEDYKEYN